jgi:hypothetical protein
MKSHNVISVCLFFSLLCTFKDSSGYCNSVLQFEETLPSVILEVKQIQVPGYPFAFNPSIVRWRGLLVMSFRDVYDPLLLSDFDSAGNSRIGIVFLNDDFSPLGRPHLLDLQGESWIPSRAEDPRLIAIGDRLYIVYSDNKEEWPTKGGYRMYVAELHFDGSRFSVQEIEGLFNFEGENPQRREKNWVPFENNGELLLAYSLNPHCIMRPLLGSSQCETVAKSEGVISWEWGELRGGTPGLLIDDHHYLSFFHSSKSFSSVFSNGEKILHYFIGAYTFSAHLPFEITQISPKPLVSKEFYADNVYVPYWKPLNVVFPGGFVHDDQNIWMVYGRHDHEMWVVKFDKQGLLDTLVPVNH